MPNYKHGLAYHPIYNLWHRMVQRCHDTTSRDYPRYGGRGIVVCDRWRYDAAAFIADMGERPPGMSLDRIDNDGPYSPENCRWADRKTQARNSRNAHLIEYNGKVMAMASWADYLGVPDYVIYNRLHAGWSIERIMTTPYSPRPRTRL